MHENLSHAVARHLSAARGINYDAVTVKSKGRLGNKGFPDNQFSKKTTSVKSGTEAPRYHNCVRPVLAVR